METQEELLHLKLANLQLVTENELYKAQLKQAHTTITKLQNKTHPHLEIRTMSSTIDCPKCGHEHISDGYDHEYDNIEMECEKCEFIFSITIEWDPNFTTKCKTHEFGEKEPIQKFNNIAGWLRKCHNCGEIEIQEEKML